MKKNYTTAYTAIFLTLLLALEGCTGSKQALKCPDFTSQKPHEVHWVKKSTKHQHPTPQPVATLTASTQPEIAIDIKLPKSLSSKMATDGQLNKMNELFGNYSGNKVKLYRKANGKIFLHSNSYQDINKMTTNMMKNRKAYYEGGGGGGIALAAGIIGIVAFVFALGPFISLAAFWLGVVALILGILGLHSDRHGWAVLGIVFGVLAIFLSLILGVFVYIVVLHF